MDISTTGSLVKHFSLHTITAEEHLRLFNNKNRLSTRYSIKNIEAAIHRVRFALLVNYSSQIVSTVFNLLQ